MKAKLAKEPADWQGLGNTVPKRLTAGKAALKHSHEWQKALKIKKSAILYLTFFANMIYLGN